MNLSRSSLGALGCMAFALFLTACTPTLSPFPASKVGSLQVMFSNNVNSRTLVPPLDMTVASYAVTGIGPGGATFTATSTGTTVTQTGLAVGSWTVVVNASNAGGTVIGQGTATVQLTAGQTATAAVSVTPITGTGTLSLTVSWPSTVTNPSITAGLTPALGTAQPLVFTITGTTATYSNATVGNGYYTLAFTLMQNGTVVAGAVDVVRIVAGQTTSGTYAFSSVNSDPIIVVNITPNPLNPLTVTMSGQPAAAVAPGSSVTLSASVPAGTGNVTYTWYVNGAAEAIASSYTLNSSAAPLVVGTYRVDVTAFTANGLQAGSATYTLSVQQSAAQTYSTSFPLTENPISEGGNWINGGVVGLDWNNMLTTPGLAQGQGPASVAYSDPTAVLAGTWGANQTAQAVVYSVNQTTSYYQEVELRLLTTITAHSITGYEINFRCLKTSAAYMQIVRWNGALGNFTVLANYSGAQYGVANGDVVKASVVGGTITVWINGVVAGSATDTTFTSGSPGMGMDFGCGSTYGNFGFSSFTASSP